MVIKLQDSSDILSDICSSKKLWGIYASHCFFEEPHTEINKAIPFLSEKEAIDFWHKGFIYMLFDTWAEMDYYYKSIVGDDGPTETNPYNGIVKVYALSCDKCGQLMNENT